MADKSGKSTKKSGLALACILLAVLLIFIFFLVKKDSILTNLKETRFFERVFGSTPEFVENHKPSEKDEVKIPLNEKSDDQISIKIEPESSAAKPKQETQAQKTQDSVAKNDADSEKAQDSTKKTAEKIETPAKTTGTTDLYLCFVEIDPDGSIIRKLIKRTVPKTDSPLSAAINLVLQGPDTTKAEERNCTTLIPYGTKLLGARVTDGVAYLDFNDNF
jgi:spore germination protein GerM